MSWQYPLNKKKDKFVLITSLEQCCLTAKDIKLNTILILQKWCQGLIFSLQVHWLINMRERTVIIGWKWHQKLSKLWKGLPLNGFEPWIKKTINWEEAGVILTAQNKTNREGEVCVCVCGLWVWKRCRCVLLSMNNPMSLPSEGVFSWFSSLSALW